MLKGDDHTEFGGVHTSPCNLSLKATGFEAVDGLLRIGLFDGASEPALHARNAGGLNTIGCAQLANRFREIVP